MEIKTYSQIPKIQRLAKEGKQEEYDNDIFNFMRLTSTYEDLTKNFKDKKFLKYFEYI